MPHFTVDLPFHNVECFFKSHRQTQTRPLDIRNGVPSNLSVVSAHYDSVWLPIREMLKPLQAMVPNMTTLDTSFDYSLVENSQPPPLSPSFLLDILYSLSNNHLDIFWLPADMIKLLRHEITRSFNQISSSMPESYTVQAVALSLFTASIEIGDSDSLDYVLKSSIYDIHANRPIGPRYDSYTPLHRAIELGHREVIRVLLSHGAEVNVDFHDGVNSSPLDELSMSSSVLKDDGSDSEIFTILLNAGGMCSKVGLCNFGDRFPNSPYAREIIERRAIFDFNHLNMRIFQPIFEFQGHDTCLQLLAIMREQDFNINTTTSPHNESILDVCVLSGRFRLVQFLLNNGAKFTRTTLIHAIARGDEAILELLFDHKDRAAENTWEDPTLVEAIRTRSTTIISLVISHYGLSKTDVGGSSIMSMSKIGDVAWIEGLLSALDITDPENLNVVLVFAIQTDRRELASRLIDDIVHPVSGESLMVVLKQRDLGLLRALLNAGTILEYWDSEEAIKLAVEWGDRQVVLDILEATATRYYGSQQAIPALISAIRREDKDMVDLLLEFGVDINFKNKRREDSALNEAVRTGDINWIEYILEQGPDPHNPSAFMSAMQDKRVFEQLLRKHVVRYPKGPRDWGSGIFKEIMDRGAYNTFKQRLERGASPLYSSSDNAFAYAITHSHKIGCKYVELLLHWKEKTNCSPETIVAADCIGFSGLKEKRRTAFEVAIGTGYRPTIDIFLRHGANVNFPAVRRRTRTPLQAAVEHGDSEIVKLLLSCGADVNGIAARMTGATALQLAVIAGNIPLCQLLMENGADLHAPAARIDGRMPLEGAAEHGRLDMVAFLLAAGAGHRGEDKEQFERAISFANAEGYSHIADMLTRYLEDGKVHVASRLPLEEYIDFNGMVED